MKIILLVAGLSVAMEASAGTLPGDPCALLEPAGIQALAPNAKIGNGVVARGTAPLSAACTYTWGPRTREWGESSVQVTVIDASRAWQGMSPDLIKQGILIKARSGPQASQVAGVGDAAAFTFEARSSNAAAEAYLKSKDVHVSVSYHGGDALANKDKVIALLKAAAARL